MPSPMGSFFSAKPSVGLVPLSIELRQSQAEPVRRDALRKQRSRLAEARRPEAPQQKG
jgi:hypothetical protein